MLKFAEIDSKVTEKNNACDLKIIRMSHRKNSTKINY